MKVNLIPEISYRVETESGEPLGVFTKKSEWKGFTEYVDGMNELIVLSPPRLEDIFSRDNARVADVVRASPLLMEQLLSKTETETESTK